MKTLTYVNTALIIVALLIGIANLIRQPVANFGGVTNLDSLTLGDNLVVTGTSTLTGATTQTGALTIAGNLITDGGLLVGGVYDYGESASVALGAAQVCDYNIIQIDADGSGDDVGASISFPDDETLQADCLSAAGDSRRFYIDGTSSITTTYLDITTTGLNFDYATGYESDYDGGHLLIIDVWNDGTSLSWMLDAVDASTSFQLND